MVPFIDIAKPMRVAHHWNRLDAQAWNQRVLGLNRRSEGFWRMATMSSKLAVSGWLLSVQPTIFEDAKANSLQEHEQALEDVVRTFLTIQKRTKEQLDKKVEELMMKHQDFQNKTGMFQSATIWNVSCALDGKSHHWHKFHSKKCNKEFGLICC